MQGMSNSPLLWTTAPLKTQIMSTRMISTTYCRWQMMTFQDVLLLVGDLNARVGYNNKNRESAMEKHGVGDLTNNGERVINLWGDNKLIIGGTRLMHRNIHKLTRTSSDGRTQSQVDHIIINSKWRGSLQDVRAMRNANVGSDHNLLVAKMTLKLRNAKIGMTRNQQPDNSKLKDTLIMEKFSIMLRNRFSILQDETALTIDDFNSGMM